MGILVMGFDCWVLEFEVILLEREILVGKLEEKKGRGFEGRRDEERREGGGIWRGWSFGNSEDFL